MTIDNRLSLFGCMLLTVSMFLIAGCERRIAEVAPASTVPTKVTFPEQIQPEPTPTGSSGSVIQPRTNENEIRIIAWNVESDGNFPAVIASQLSNELAGYDIYALSEVLPTSFKQYADAVGPSFISIESTTGRDDRLQLLVNFKRFEIIGREELTQQGDFRLNDGNHRSPLVAHLLDRTSDKSFLIAVNHLCEATQHRVKNKRLGFANGRGCKRFQRSRLVISTLTIRSSASRAMLVSPR